MSARYPYYFLADSPEGRDKEQELTKTVQLDTSTASDILSPGFTVETFSLSGPP